MAEDDYTRKITPEQLLRMVYDKVLDLDLKFDLLDAKIEALQQDVSHYTFVRSELIKLRFDHNTDELYITEFFKIQFEGNQAVLLRHIFKKSSGLPKKSKKFYPSELAGKFEKETDGLKTEKSVLAAIHRIDKAIKYRAMGLEVFKIKTKVFYFI